MNVEGNAAVAPGKDRTFFIFNAVVSTVAVLFIAWLLFGRREESGALDLRFMPALNAALNAFSTAMLTGGLVAARARRTDVHRYFMIAACVASALFLVGYLSYHYAHGDTKYAGDHRALYLLVLATHVLLSVTIVPGALTALYFAWRRQFSRHTRVTRVLIWVWLYVSTTGVLIYFMLRGSRGA